MRLFLAALALACAPVASAADVYHWCYVQTGLATADVPGKRYFSGVTSAGRGEKIEIGNRFHAHVRANYDAEPNKSFCTTAESRQGALDARGRAMADARRLNYTVVSTGWKWRR